MKGQLSQLFPFVHFFYGFKVPLFFNYHYSSRALSIIFSFMGICQGDPFVRVFFMLVHFHTLCCASWVSSLCLFPSLVDDTHIFDPTHVISLVSDHFVSHLASMGLIVQLCKCLAQASSNLFLWFIPLVEFYAPFDGIKILGVPFGFASFAFSFLQEVLSENVRHVDVFPRLRNVQVAFDILF